MDGVHHLRRCHQRFLQCMYAYICADDNVIGPYYAITAFSSHTRGLYNHSHTNTGHWVRPSIFFSKSSDPTPPPPTRNLANDRRYYGNDMRCVDRVCSGVDVECVCVQLNTTSWSVSWTGIGSTQLAGATSSPSVQRFDSHLKHANSLGLYFHAVVDWRYK